MTKGVHILRQAQDERLPAQDERIPADISYCIAQDKRLPADISYCIADLKFDGQHINICELGTCTWSYFKGHEALYGPGRIWQNIWKHLSQFKVPIWYVGTIPLSEARKREVGFNELKEAGGSVVDSLQTLSQTIRSKAKHVVENPYAINNYQGIVVLRNRHHNETKLSIKEFREKHPTILILDTATSPYVNNKAATNKLFDDPMLRELKPDWRIYKKEYTQNTTQQIINEFNHDTYVIKPTNTAEGRGVLIVTKQELNDTLKKILTDTKSLKTSSDSSYSYWGVDNQSEFIMESYAPSKPITVDNKRYDATMRVVFALTYHNQKISTDFLGFYWKLPTQDLDSKRSLNDMHKSKVAKGRKSSAIVSQSDIDYVSAVLKEALPVLYAKML